MSLLQEHLTLLAERAGATSETSDLVAAFALESIRLGPDGAVTVIDAAGNARIGGAAGGYGNMTPAELVQEIAQRQPVLFRRPEPEPVPAPAPQAEPEGINHTLDVFRRARADKAVAKTSAADGPNPYRRASWNLTRQAALEATNPALVDQLKAEAAAIPPHLDIRFP